MYCKECGNKLEDGNKFCAKCGTPVKAKVEKVEAEEVPNEKKTVKPEMPHEAKCWSIFAKVGFGCGIGALAASWLPGWGMVAGICGIVFSILGKKSSMDDAMSKSKAGLIMSIIGTVLSFLFIFVWIGLEIAAIM